MKGNDGQRVHGWLSWNGLSSQPAVRLNDRAAKLARAFSNFSTHLNKASAPAFQNGPTKRECSYTEDSSRSRRLGLGITGALASATPQCILIGLDVMKSNMQTNPSKYQNMSSTYHLLLATEGSQALRRGLVPTIVGYSLHGFVKYQMFDWFQGVYSGCLGADVTEKHAEKVRCLSMASAEFVAVIPLSPFAMVKLKLETSTRGCWPTRFVPAVMKMHALRAHTGFPFRPIVPMWLRQIPLAVTQLYLFGMFRSKLSTFVDPEERCGEYKRGAELGITITSGYGAALISTLLSQPADYTLSRLTLSRYRGKSVAQVMAEDGVRNALTRGLRARYAMVGMMTAMQFSILEGAWRGTQE